MSQWFRSNWVAGRQEGRERGDSDDFMVTFLRQELWTRCFLGGWQLKHFWNFHRYLGKISNLTNIFQRGWNHQLVLFLLTNWFRWHGFDWDFNSRVFSERWDIQFVFYAVFGQMFHFGASFYYFCLLISMNFARWFASSLYPPKSQSIPICSRLRWRAGSKL